MKKEELLKISDLEGKVALITGATGAFGSTASMAHSALGAKVALAGRREPVLKELAERIKLQGGIASYVKGHPLSTRTARRSFRGPWRSSVSSTSSLWQPVSTTTAPLTSRTGKNGNWWWT